MTERGSIKAKTIWVLYSCCLYHAAARCRTQETKLKMIFEMMHTDTRLMIQCDVRGWLRPVTLRTCPIVPATASIKTWALPPAARGRCRGGIIPPLSSVDIDQPSTVSCWDTGLVGYHASWPGINIQYTRSGAKIWNNLSQTVKSNGAEEQLKDQSMNV